MKTIAIQGVVTFKDEVFAVKGLDENNHPFYVEQDKLDGYPKEFLLTLKQYKLVEEVELAENAVELQKVLYGAKQDEELIKTFLSELSMEYMMYQSDRENCYYRVFATVYQDEKRTRVAGIVIDSGGLITAINSVKQLCMDKYNVKEHDVIIASISQIIGDRDKKEIEVSRESYKDFYKRYGKNRELI